MLQGTGNFEVQDPTTIADAALLLFDLKTISLDSFEAKKNRCSSVPSLLKVAKEFGIVCPTTESGFALRVVMTKAIAVLKTEFRSSPLGIAGCIMGMRLRRGLIVRIGSRLLLLLRQCSTRNAQTLISLKRHAVWAN